MATAESIKAVWDIEGIVEAAVKAVLTDAAIKLAEGGANVPSFASADIAIERPRPRIEILFSLGDATGHQQVFNGDRIHDIFRGALAVQVVADSDRYADLRLLVALLRELTARWLTLINAKMDKHALKDLVPAGASPVFQTDKGYFAATLRFNGQVCIRPEAMTAIMQP